MNIELKCPRCDSDNLARDGKKSDGPQSQSPPAKPGVYHI